jgi:hypothetical protein
MMRRRHVFALCAAAAGVAAAAGCSSLDGPYCPLVNGAALPPHGAALLRPPPPSPPPSFFDDALAGAHLLAPRRPLPPHLEPLGKLLSSLFLPRTADGGSPQRQQRGAGGGASASEDVTRLTFDSADDVLAAPYLTDRVKAAVVAALAQMDAQETAAAVARWKAKVTGASGEPAAAGGRGGTRVHPSRQAPAPTTPAGGNADVVTSLADSDVDHAEQQQPDEDASGNGADSAEPQRRSRATAAAAAARKRARGGKQRPSWWVEDLRSSDRVGSGSGDEEPSRPAPAPGTSAVADRDDRDASTAGAGGSPRAGAGRGAPPHAQQPRARGGGGGDGGR